MVKEWLENGVRAMKIVHLTNMHDEEQTGRLSIQIDDIVAQVNRKLLNDQRSRISALGARWLSKMLTT